MYDILFSSQHSMSQNKNKIEFEVENIFTFGNPLGVFLALNGIRPINTGNREHILPKKIFKNYYNIFHPSDPIAYRLEPLILKEYSAKPAVMIQKHDAPLKYSYDNINGNRTENDNVKLEEAIDFQVQNSTFKFMDHLRSHWGYWNSCDVAYFIINQIYLKE